MCDNGVGNITSFPPAAVGKSFAKNVIRNTHHCVRMDELQSLFQPSELVVQLNITIQIHLIKMHYKKEQETIGTVIKTERLIKGIKDRV